jgi:hypothetical protein
MNMSSEQAHPETGVTAATDLHNSLQMEERDAGLTSCNPQSATKPPISL